MFLVPLGSNVWPRCMHESLAIAIVTPLLDRVPWSLRATKLAGDLEKDMSGVWDTDCRREGARLRKFWDQATSLGSMPRSLARELLQAKRSGPVPNSEHKGLLDEHENSNKENPRNREPGCIYTIEY
jgi:hypothetical protein